MNDAGDMPQDAMNGDGGTIVLRLAAVAFALCLGGAALFFWAAYGPQVFADMALRVWAACF
jgi:hypothetical protein